MKQPSNDLTPTQRGSAWARARTIGEQQKFFGDGGEDTTPLVNVGNELCERTNETSSTHVMAKHEFDMIWN